MNKALLTALLAATLSAKAAEMLPMPNRIAASTVPSAEVIAKRIAGLNSYIGGYPPQIANDQQRAQVYKDWTDLLRIGWKLEDAAPQAEFSLYVLADLYRQGHNLDVDGAAQKAMDALDRCLAAYPDSVSCHWTASYLYLSIHPSVAPKGEASLLRLRQLLKDQPSKEVERGLVFAYLSQQKMDEALRQMDYYLTLVPGDERMRGMRDAVVNKRFQIKQK
jgi:tetratricopeptide (TPR) repeat protein